MDTVEWTKRLGENPHPVIVDFWAPWCGPCKMMAPAVEQMEQKYAGEVDVWKINADEAPELAQLLKVYGIPTLIGFSQGREVVRRTGAQSTELLDVFFSAMKRPDEPVILPPAPADRLLRGGSGLAVLALGWFSGQSILLLGVGALLLFSAVYDRCPIYRALAPRVKALLRR